jgi:ABC-type branched-subunit amino acid transport system substrate-binding protein
LIVNSLIAAGLSSMILFKGNDSKEEDKTNIFLTLGLVFWFIANIIWAYYEIVLDIVSPVPSLADLFLLSAYGFLIYRLIVIYRNLGHITNKKILLLIISGTGLFLIYILNLTLDQVPDDTYQGKIVAERMISDGIKVIVPIWRGEIYGNELYKSTKSHFEKLGGKVEEGINYKPYTGKFATSLHRINFLMWNQELEKLNVIVSDAVKKYGANSVGVYVISFDEITPILIQSPLYENLGKVRWYGSDKIAQNHQITKNVDSASFAMKVNLSNPLYSIDTESKKSHDLKEVLEKQLHEVSSITYPALAYDSYWIAALSLDKNSTFNYGNENLTKSFKEIIVETAESFDGISGKIKLNKAGDRIGGNYDFWIVAKDKYTQSYEWEKEHNLRIERSVNES